MQHDTRFFCPFEISADKIVQKSCRFFWFIFFVSVQFWYMFWVVKLLEVHSDKLKMNLRRESFLSLSFNSTESGEQ